jgi:hypothetical protein
MGPHLSNRVGLIASSLLAATLPSFAQQPSAESHVSRLRTLFFERNYEVGVLEGAKREPAGKTMP